MDSGVRFDEGIDGINGIRYDMDHRTADEMTYHSGKGGIR